MKKVLLLLLILFIFPRFVEAQTLLKGFVEKRWTVDSARQEAFLNLEKVKDLSMFDSIDPNFIENRQAINKKLSKIENREIVIFSNGSYGIRVLSDDLFDKSFTYNSSGKLQKIHYDSYSEKITKFSDLKKSNPQSFYPFKVIGYLYPSGDILSISIIVGKDNSYTFNEDGSLNVHWVGNKGYDADGKVRMTRK